MKDMLPEYVDELKPYDIGMLEHNLSRNAKDYKTTNVRKALLIIQDLLDKTLKKVGINISEDSSATAVDAALAKNNVKVEHRAKYSDEDSWRNGIYVYKGMDLVGFISEPLYKKPSIFEIDITPFVFVRAALQ